MTNDALPGMNYDPIPEKVIDDVEALKIYFDPLRLRIVQEIADEARSIHAIAHALQVPFTRMYYHINLLEKAGFIRLVEVRRGAGAIEEKYYRVAARFFSVNRRLMTAGTPAGDAGLDTVIETVLDETKRSIYESVKAGLIDTTQRAPHPDALLIVRAVFALSPRQIIDFQTRLRALILDFNNERLEAGSPIRDYNFAVVLHPTRLDHSTDTGDLDQPPIS